MPVTEWSTISQIEQEDRTRAQGFGYVFYYYFGGRTETAWL